MAVADELTKSQAARRDRVVAAAMELAAEGGYELVQMRDVAARADVALGTIYRYFVGKDHLLAAALVSWTHVLEERVSQRPPRGDTTAERMIEVLSRGIRAMEREPKLAAAVITALSSSDPEVVECQLEVTRIISGIQATAFPRGFDPDLQARVIRTLGLVWFASLLGWVNGWSGISEAGEELASASHLLLDQYG
jgi:AcrR family transcriptional regulator